MRHGAAKIGCPGWAHPPWSGRFFTHTARREDYLSQYASVFGAAEGNATFYGLPAPATLARWAEAAPAAFRFCFKFPKAVSHEAQLLGPGAGMVRSFASSWSVWPRWVPGAGLFCFSSIPVSVRCGSRCCANGWRGSPARPATRPRRSRSR